MEVVGKEIKLSYRLKDNFIEEFTSVARELLDVLNAMESFSVFFVSRVADDSVAFSSVGETFCNSVKEHLPIIMLLGEGRHYRNVVQLFLTWNERIDSRKLVLDRAKIDARLKKLENRVIDPLGAEND